MIGNRIQVEELESGIQAAFINLPHFRTHAGRLLVYAGSMHEDQAARGSAHFLEHIAFQGTQGLDSERKQHEYAEEKGLYVNAATAKTHTSYIADGYDLNPVGYYLTQTALFPLLTNEALERERKPIIDELQSYASSPGWLASLAHARAIRGEEYARFVGGTVEEVRELSPYNLQDFYRRNYRLGNILLILCSAEDVERQREYANELTQGLNAAESNGKDVKLPLFNPGGLEASLQSVDLPSSAQTSVTISYGLPEATSRHEQWSFNMLGAILSKAAHRRLRSELAMCYGANADVSKLADLRFGRNKNWSHLSASASLDGQDSIEGLNALFSDVISTPISQALFESMQTDYRRRVNHLLQNTPSGVADVVQHEFANYRREEMHMEELIVFADTISLKALRKLQKDITDTRPLVLATSPSDDVLRAVGEWAASLNA
jgi:predicted Zn-dependent peptidase